MATQQKNVLPQEYVSILERTPLWDDRVWEPLQKKDYETAMGELVGLMGLYTQKTALEIFWKDIIEGTPAVRGVVSAEEWRENVLPYLANIILEISEKNLIEKIYSTTDPDWLTPLHFLIVAEIPGFSTEEKIEYLSKEKPWLLDYFTGSPLNVLGEGLLIPVSEGIAIKKIGSFSKYWKYLPPGLQGTFYSIEGAQTLINICESYELDRQQIVDIAYSIGAVLLSADTIEEWSDSVRGIFESSNKKFTDQALDDLQQNFINPFRGEIAELKESIEPVIKEKEITVPIATAEETKEAPVKVNKIEFPKAITEEPKTPSEPNAPFILFKGQDASPKADTGSSAFSKGFSLPFGFFKGRKPAAETPKVSVKIESGASPAGPTGAPKIGKSSPSIFEGVETRLSGKKNGVFGAVKEEIKKLPSSKTVHYSEYRTEVPPADPKPTVDGNTVSFK